MAVVKNTPNSSSIGYPTGDERSQDYLESRLNIELNLMGNNGDMGLETRLIAVSWKLDSKIFDCKTLYFSATANSLLSGS